jgi:GH25 family lysozyme M1 (1,4-beta-N-acetylmuramidase)
MALMALMALPGPPAAATGNAAAAAPAVAGFDISNSQGVPDFAAAKRNGAAFVYVKDTAGVGYVSDGFLAQFRGAKAAGLLRGAYHYARPDKSTGAAQADYLHANDGKWFTDGVTLPPALDLEATPNVDPCYGLDPARMVGWIREFSDRATTLTGHRPLIYTSTSWWQSCTRDSHAFAATHRLWLARYAPSVGSVPGGWPAQAVWQSGRTGPLPGNQDVFNGTLDQLKELTTGG